MHDSLHACMRIKAAEAMRAPCSCAWRLAWSMLDRLQPVCHSLLTPNDCSRTPPDRKLHSTVVPLQLLIGLAMLVSETASCMQTFRRGRACGEGAALQRSSVWVATCNNTSRTSLINDCNLVVRVRKIGTMVRRNGCQIVGSEGRWAER